jgi:hypothetical protein
VGLHRTFLGPLQGIHCELDFMQNPDTAGYTPIAVSFSVPPGALAAESGAVNYSVRFTVGTTTNVLSAWIAPVDGGAYARNAGVARPPFGVWLHVALDVAFDTGVTMLRMGDPAPAIVSVTAPPSPSVASVDFDFGALYNGGVFAPTDRDFDNVVCDVR